MLNFLILLPITLYFLLISLFTQKADFHGILKSLVKGHVVLFTFIAVSTEALSSMHFISFPGILASWLLFLGLGLLFAFKHAGKNSFSLPLLNMNPSTIIFLCVIAFILASTFAAAILYPPNNWDSMVYHMARVPHWIADKSVDFYSTSITAQNYQMPLAEYAILHLQILTGGDFFANLVQWMSFLVLICLGFLIAGELGLDRRQQMISALVIATLPLAILQASSTQNDLVVSCFLLCFCLFMLQLRENMSFENILFSGMSLGLALLTKGTAYVYSAPMGIALAVPVLFASRHDLRRFSRTTAALLLIVVIGLFLNAGHFWRSYQLDGNPMSTEGDNWYINSPLSLKTLVKNAFFNAALHLGTPFEQVNRLQIPAAKLIFGPERAEKMIEQYPQLIRYRRHEDSAGNLIQLLVALLGILLLPIRWLKGEAKAAMLYALGILAGAVLFCLLLFWQPWESRLQTPLFAMAAPLLAVTLTSGTGKRIGYGIIVLMVLYSLPFALDNETRSLLSLDWKHYGRNQLYFQNRRDAFEDYKSAVDVLEKTGCNQVGLYQDPGGDWEYPFWALAAQNKSNPTTFFDVGVSNVTNKLNENTPLPLYVAATIPLDTWEYAKSYVPVYRSKYVSVFKKLQP